MKSVCFLMCMFRLSTKSGVIKSLKLKQNQLEIAKVNNYKKNIKIRIKIIHQMKVTINKKIKKKYIQETRNKLDRRLSMLAILTFDEKQKKTDET